MFLSGGRVHATKKNKKNNHHKHNILGGLGQGPQDAKNRSPNQLVASSNNWGDLTPPTKKTVGDHARRLNWGGNPL